MAWAALWRLSGVDAVGLDRRSSSRLFERLSSLDAEGLVHACRRRAVVRHYRASASFLGELGAAAVGTGTAAMTSAAFRMSRDSACVDGYCDAGALAGLVRDFHLVEDSHGNVTLRAGSLRALPIGDPEEMPVAVVAADLAESFEVPFNDSVRSYASKIFLISSADFMVSLLGATGASAPPIAPEEGRAPGKPVRQTTSCRADPTTISGQISRPPTGT